jgi:hypothetical protein
MENIMKTQRGGKKLIAKDIHEKGIPLIKF